MAMSKQKNKILLVGSLPNKYPNSIGGATMLFKNLVDYCNENQQQHSLLTSNLFNFRLYSVPDILRVYCLGFFKLLFADVAMINVSGRGISWVAPYFILLGKIFDKKIIIRVFGGNLAETFDVTEGRKKKILAWVIKNAHVLFVETKILVNYFEPHNPNTKWLPNVREPIVNNTQKTSFSKRFIFLGQIKKSKGIDQLLAVKARLNKDYELHLYGPILDNKYDSLEASIYKGILRKEQVAGILQQYDVLILPTFWKGEGYPGVIIEGYALGLPCITTRWKAIPEIVDEGKTGLLITPKSVDELYEAILHFDEKNYPAMSDAARQKFSKFNSEEVNAELLSLLHHI